HFDFSQPVAVKQQDKMGPPRSTWETIPAGSTINPSAQANKPAANNNVTLLNKSGGLEPVSIDRPGVAKPASANGISTSLKELDKEVSAPPKMTVTTIDLEALNQPPAEASPPKSDADKMLPGPQMLWYEIKEGSSVPDEKTAVPLFAVPESKS